MFNLNFNQLLHDWTAPTDRTPARMALMRVFLRGLKMLWQDHVAFHNDAIRRASATGQIMSLERMLNLRWYGVSAWKSLAEPTAGGRIWIENTASILPSVYIYSDNENQAPLTIYSDAEAQPPVYIYSATEYQAQYDFIVKVPVALTFDTAEMTALVEEYKIGGVKFIIQTY